MPRFIHFCTQILAASLLLFCQFPTSVQAEPLSLELGLGGELLSWTSFEFTHQIRLAYPIPQTESWEAVLGLTTAPLFWGLDLLSLSGRYHWGPAMGWQPYAQVGAAWMPIRRGEWGIQLGAGFNQWLAPDFALTWNAGLIVPPAALNLMTINADIGLKWQWQI